MVFLLLSVALTGHAQLRVSDPYNANAKVDYPVAQQTPQPTLLEQQQRRADLRAALRVQAHNESHQSPRRLTLAQRAQLRQQLKAQRKEALSQTP